MAKSIDSREPLNVLIIEDVHDQFIRMKNRLTTTYGSFLNIYPTQFNVTSESLYNWAKLIKLVNEKNFTDIITFYGDIDIFIVDDEILNAKNRGTDFRNFLVSENYRGHHYKVIFTTANKKNELKLANWNEKREAYVFKDDGNVLGEVIKNINILEDIDEADLVKKKAQNKVYTIGETFHFLWMILTKRSELILDKFITLVFYLLLLLATASGGFKIADAFITTLSNHGSNTGNAKETANSAAITGAHKLPKPVIPEHTKDRLIKISAANKNSKPVVHSDKPNLSLAPQNTLGPNDSLKTNERQFDNTDKSHLEKEEIEILKTAEHIFLYLLPIFIIFGFYTYYRGYTRRSLLTNQVGELKEGASTKTMRLTKVLFASSMISYVLIKVIEHLFSPEPQLIKLIGGGVLILILLLYFGFLEHENEKE